MSTPITLSAASSFVIQSAPQCSALLSSISKVALAALTVFASQVVPTAFPIAVCLLTGIVLTFSLIHSLQNPCFLETSYVPLSPARVRPWNYDPFPYHTSIHMPAPRIIPTYSYPRRDIAIPRESFGFSRPIYTQRQPSTTFSPIRRDRVGERASF